MLVAVAVSATLGMSLVIDRIVENFWEDKIAPEIYRRVFL